MTSMGARVRNHALLMEQARLLADAALGESSAPESGRSAPADEGRLRGIPAIGPGVSGAIPGTQPERAALNRRARTVPEVAAAVARRRGDQARRARVRRLKGVLYERDQGRCHICRQACEYGEATIDHVVPMARDGTDEPENLAIAHPSCNATKGTRVAGERFAPYSRRGSECEESVHTHPPTR